MLQLTQSECGAACLSTIMGYFGRDTSMAEMRERFGPGRDGVSALDLARVARDFGLRTRVLSIDVPALASAQLPAILHWEFHHFVVLERWTSRGALLVDPSTGRRWATPRELDRNFTGIVLMFEPGPDFERRAQRPRQILLPAYLGHILFAPRARRLLLPILGLSLLGQLAGLLLPAATEVIVDRLVPRRALEPAIVLGAAMLCMAFAYGLTSYLRALLLVALQARSGANATVAFTERLLHLPLVFFQQRSSGDLLLRLSSYGVIRDTLTSQTLSALMDGLLLVGYLAVLIACDALFGLVTLGFVVVHLGWSLASLPRVRGHAAAELAAQAAAQTCAAEALKGITTLKATASEGRVLDYWSRLLVRQINLSVQRGHAMAAIDAVVGTLRMLGPAALLWIGCLRVVTGDVSLGTVFALLALAGGVLGPLQSLLKTLEAMGLVEAHLQRLDDVLEAEPERDDASLGAPRLTGRIDVHELSFRYAPRAPLVLDRVSVSVQPGQKVALVGATGSGKSTLALLLLGLLEPTDGYVAYDGIDLRQLSRSAVRRQFGTVLQEPFLFSGSIREAIAFHVPGVALDEVRRAARLAGVDVFIEGLPMAYDTLLAEGGGGLSGGQRQRVALARALVHRPRVLLLDEATSQLDVITEQEVERNLRQLGCTRIVIAHRLSTIVDADLICVLDRGRMVERGTHAELIERGGAYARLWRVADASTSRPIPVRARAAAAGVL